MFYHESQETKRLLPGPHWDIFAIGVTILRLMYPMEPYTKQRTEEGRKRREQQAQWQSKDLFNDFYIPDEYSLRLRNLVKECLLFEWWKRPDIKDLRSRTKRGRDKHVNEEWKFGTMEYVPSGADGKRVDLQDLDTRNIQELGLQHDPRHADIIMEPFMQNDIQRQMNLANGGGSGRPANVDAPAPAVPAPAAQSISSPAQPTGYKRKDRYRHEKDKKRERAKKREILKLRNDRKV